MAVSKISSKNVILSNLVSFIFALAAKMSWDLRGPCIVCHKFNVNGGLAIMTGDLRCLACKEAQLYRTVWPLEVDIAAVWSQMHKLAEEARDAQAKQDDANGIPAHLDFYSKHILREMRP